MGLEMERRSVIMLFDGFYVEMEDVTPITDGFMYGSE